LWSGGIVGGPFFWVIYWLCRGHGALVVKGESEHISSVMECVDYSLGDGLKRKCSSEIRDRSIRAMGLVLDGPID